MREKDQETQVDIIAEMRMGSPWGPCAYRIGLPDDEEVFESGATMRTIQIKDVTVQELADRLEEAAKREKAQHGNAAAMREALIWMKERIIAAIHDGALDCSEVLNKIEDALEKPARNCDIHTDFKDAITTLANKRNWHDGKWDSERYCILVSWLLAPTEEEGAGK